MTGPKVSAILFAALALIDQGAESIPDVNLKTVVKAACRLGEAVTIYLVSKGVILALKVKQD